MTRAGVAYLGMLGIRIILQPLKKTIVWKYIACSLKGLCVRCLRHIAFNLLHVTIKTYSGVQNNETRK